MSAVEYERRVTGHHLEAARPDHLLDADPNRLSRDDQARLLAQTVDDRRRDRGIDELVTAVQGRSDVVDHSCGRAKGSATPAGTILAGHEQRGAALVGEPVDDAPRPRWLRCAGCG